MKPPFLDRVVRCAWAAFFTPLPGSSDRGLKLEPIESRLLLSASPEEPLATTFTPPAIFIPAPAVDEATPQAAAPASLVSQAPAVSVSWIADGDGFWDVAANWSTNQVPGAGDDVTIDRSAGEFTITIRDARSVKSLSSAENIAITNSGALTVAETSSITGDLALSGSLTANGSLTLQGDTTWEGGSLGGTATIMNTGTLTKGAANLALLTNLLNAGTVNLSAGQLFIETGKALTNAVGGTLNLSGTMTTGGAGALANAGTLNVAAGNPTTGQLSNTGTVNVNAGTLVLFNGGSSSGIFDVDLGATVYWTNGTGSGTFNLNPGAQLNGTGAYVIGVGFGNVTLNGASVNIAPKHLMMQQFTALQGTGKLTIANGALFEFHGGSISATGGVEVQSGGLVTLRDREFGMSLSGTTLTNHGTIDAEGPEQSAAVGALSFSIFQGGTLLNAADGVINARNKFTIGGPGGSTILNLGTVNYDGTDSAGSAAAFTWGLVSNNTGTLRSVAGNFAIANTLTNSGAIVAEANGTTSFNAFSRMTPGTSWSGPGLFFVGSTVEIETGVSLAASRMQINGTVANNGALTIPNGGTLTVPSGGTITGTGTTTIASGATVTGLSLAIGSGHTFNNNGSVSLNSLQTTGGFTTATFNNNAGATVTVQPAAGGNFASISARFLFNNLGTVNLTAGTAGGSFDSILKNDGVANFAGPAEIFFSSLNASGTGTSTGTFNVAAGTTLRFFSDYTFNAGTQWLGAGVYRLAATANFGAGVVFSPQKADLLGADLRGAGSIAVPAGATWTGQSANVDDLGGFTVASGATLALVNAITFDNTPVTISGLLTITGFGANGSATLFIRNGAPVATAVGGEVRFLPTGSGTSGFGNSFSGSFTNNGLLRRTGGTGEFSVPNFFTFSNPGTFENDAGTARIFANLPQISPDQKTLTGGTWRVLGGSSLRINSIVAQDFFGNPLVTVVENAADVTLGGAGASFNALNNLERNSGRLALVDGATLTSNAMIVEPAEDPDGPIPGPLTNTGTIELGAGSVLNVGTDFTQSAAGKVIAHLAGEASFGAAVVGGTATLAGTLQALLDGAFIPGAGAAFDILTYGSRSGNFTTLTGVEPLLTATAGPAKFTLTAIGEAANLTPNALTGNGGDVGANITVNYTVANTASAGTNAGAWTDSFYLSQSPTFDLAQAVLLGRKVHTGALAGNGSYSDSATFTLPPVAAGSYFLYIVTDSRGEVADASRADNTFRGDSIAITAPTLTLGAPLAGSIAAGASRLFKVTLPAGVSRVTVNGTANGAIEIYARAGVAPTVGAFDAFAFDPTADVQSLLLTAPVAGDYFILLRGTSLAAASDAFSLLAETLPFALEESSPAGATNNGGVTLTLRGAQFTSATTVQLVPGTGAALVPTRLVVGDASTLFATFDLTGVAAGSYDIALADGAATVTLPDAFTVLPAPAVESGLTISLTLTAPARVRIGRPGTLLVTVFNASGHDVPAPLINLTASNAGLRLPGADQYQSQFVEFFVLNPEGDPTVLPAGFRASYVVSFLPFEQGEGVNTHFEVFGADQNAPIDPGKIENDTRVLRDYTEAEWALMEAQLVQQLGPTVGDYEQRLRELVPLLPEGAGDRTRPFSLLFIELLRAEAALTTSIRGRVEGAGLALGGGTLFAHDLDTGEVFGATMLNDGSFTFTRLDAGSYVFSANEVLLGTHSPVTIAENEHLTGVQLTATVGESLSGTISGAPVGGASLSLTNPAGRILVIDSGADGSYTFTGLAPGAYRLTVEADGRARAAADVNVTAGGATFHVTLAAESRITGIAPASSATRVFAARQGSTDVSGFFAVDAEEDGSFTLSGLPAGTYDLTTRAEGFIDQEITGVIVGAGATVDLGTIASILAGSISGTVSSSDPELPLPLVVVAFDGTRVAGLAQTDASGAFTITGLGPGAYVARVMVGASFVSSAPIVLAEGADATGATIDILPGGVIAGVAIDAATAQPLAGVAIFAQGDNGRAFRGRTEADGSYRITGLPVGTYRVFVSLSGADAAEIVNVPSLSGPDIVLNLAATISSRLTGQLRLADGTPLARGTVVLLRDGRPVVTSFTGDDGQFGFLLQQAGTYELRASASDATFAPVTGIVVNAGQSVTQDLVAGTGTLALTITDSFSVEGATVELTSALSEEPLIVRVLDGSGTVTFDNLAAGSYRVAIRARDDRGAFASFNVTAGDTSSAVVALAQQFRLSGTVSPAASGPALSRTANVSVYSVSDPLLSFSALVAADGSYAIGNLPAGQYQLISLDAGHRPFVQTITVSADADIDVTFAQIADTHLTGRILDAAGAPLRHAIVSARDASGRGLAFVRTDASGNFDLAGLTQPGVEITYSIYGLGPFVIASAFDASTLSGLPGKAASLGDTVAETAFAGTSAQAVEEPPPLFLGARSAATRAFAADAAGAVAFGFPPDLTGATALFEPVKKRAEKFKEDKKHVHDPFDQSPECIDCDRQRFAARGARDRQDLSFDKAKELKEILLTSIERESSTILKECYQNYGFAFQAAGLAVTVLTLAGPSLGLALPAAGAALTAEEAAFVALVTDWGNATVSALDLVQAIYTFWNQLNQVLTPSKEPGDTYTGLEFTTQVVTNLFKAAGTLEKVLIEHAQKTFHLDWLFVVSDLVGNAGQARGTLASINFDASKKGALEVAQDYKKFEEARRKYKEDVKEANEKKDAFYDCLKGSSASEDCDDNGGDPGKPNDDDGGGGDDDDDDDGDTGQGASLDPNDITGPAGFGDARFVAVKTALPYTIRFENVATATANAAEVFISQTLDADLDLTTLRPLSYGFGELSFDVPAGANPFNFETRLDLVNSLGVFVDVDVSLDLATRELSWTFRSIDPLTGDVPGDASLGFLPPNVTGPQGEGFVVYSVEAKAGAAAGAVIDAQAEIVFDTNPPILTPAISNAIDAIAPVATFAPLPPQVGPDFTLQWSGTDDAGGSGVTGYDVLVSDNGGAFTPLLSNSPRTALAFIGTVGHTYRFVVLARDGAGNVEALPAGADATVTIVPAVQKVVDAKTPFSFLDANGERVTVKLTGPGSAVATLVNGVADNADLRSLVFTDTTDKTSLSITVAKKGTTNVGRLTAGGTAGFNAITLGKGVTLGDGVDDLSFDVSIGGAVKKLALSDIADETEIRIGAGLAPGATFAPSLAANDLGMNVHFDLRGGLGKTTIGSWDFGGSLATLQAVGAFTLLRGNFTGALQVDAAGSAPGVAGLGAFTVKAGSLSTAAFSVEGAVGAVTVGATINSLLIAGSFGNVTAGAINFSGFVATTGGFGNVLVKSGGIVASQFTATLGNIGSITAALAKQTGAVRALDGVTVTARSIGNITGTVAGLAGLTEARGIVNSGFTATAGGIGKITAAVSGSGLADGVAIDFSDFTSVTGSLGSISATATSGAATTALTAIRESDFQASQNIGSVIASASAASKAPAAGSTAAIRGNAFNVNFQAGGSIGAVKVLAQGAAGSNVAFATDLASRIVFNAGGALGNVTITANKGAAAPSDTRAGSSGDFFATTIGNVKIAGDATANQAEDFVFFASGKIAGIEVSAKTKAFGTLSGSFVIAGQAQAQPASTADLAQASLGPVRLSGALRDSVVAAGGNLGAVSVGRDATGSWIVAGAKTGGDRFFLTADDTFNAHGSIASVKVGGLFAGTTLAAGVDPGAGLVFGDGDDIAAAATPGFAARSRIGAVSLGTSLPQAASMILKPPLLAHFDAIESLTLTSVRIGKQPVFTNFTEPAYLDGSGDGAAQADEVIIRQILP